MSSSIRQHLISSLHVAISVHVPFLDERGNDMCPSLKKYLRR